MPSSRPSVEVVGLTLLRQLRSSVVPRSLLFHTLLPRCFGVVIFRSGQLCSLVSSVVVANNILLAELIGQGSIGQADSERPLLDDKANYFKWTVALIDK